MEKTELEEIVERLSDRYGRGKQMEKTELEEIVERLSDRYGRGKHFEVIFADKKCDGTWSLVVKEIKDETDKSEEKGEQE